MLTEAEEIYYATYALIEECDCCHNLFPIHAENDIYIIYNGIQFICTKCNYGSVVK